MGQVIGYSKHGMIPWYAMKYDQPLTLVAFQDLFLRFRKRIPGYPRNSWAKSPSKRWFKTYIPFHGANSATEQPLTQPLLTLVTTCCVSAACVPRVVLNLVIGKGQADLALAPGANDARSNESAGGKQVHQLLGNRILKSVVK